MDLLQRVRTVADEILADDPQLEAAEHVLLKDAIVARFGADLEPIPA